MDESLYEFDSPYRPPQKDNGYWIFGIIAAILLLVGIGCFVEQWLFDMPRLKEMNEQYEKNVALRDKK